jgi:hypothetical protein
MEHLRSHPFDSHTPHRLLPSSHGVQLGGDGGEPATAATAAMVTRPATGTARQHGGALTDARGERERERAREREREGARARVIGRKAGTACVHCSMGCSIHARCQVQTHLDSTCAPGTRLESGCLMSCLYVSQCQCSRAELCRRVGVVRCGANALLTDGTR